MKKALSILLDTFLILAASLLALILAAWLMGYLPKIVVSGSMGNVVPIGALAFIDTNTPYDEIKEGDIIAFHATETLQVTHRVIRITPEGLITKGDSNKEEDISPVTRDRYIGKTTLVIPQIGKFWIVIHDLWKG